MVKITWLGEDFDEAVPGPSFNVWNGVKFPKGQAVEVSDEHMIAKARNHALYKVFESGGVAGRAGSPTPDQTEADHGKETKANDQVEPQPEKQEEQTGQETGSEGYNFRQAEKGSGYSPVPPKKRVRKPAKPAAGVKPEVSNGNSPEDPQRSG